VITLAVDTDQILAVLEELLNGATKCTDKASRLLEVFDDLNSYSENMNKSLTDSARGAFEELWVNWSAQLLDMAGYLESVGILLNNAAVLYLSQDLEVAKAFGLDPAQAKEINKEIDNIKNQNEEFKKKFDEDIQKVKEVQKKAEEDKNADPVVDVSQDGEPIYESKEFPGDRYMKRDDGGKIWIGEAKFKHKDDPPKDGGNIVNDAAKEVFGDKPEAINDYTDL
jgi:uncharacterized protein YukE